MRHSLCIVVLALASGCHASHQRVDDAGATACDPTTRPTCVTRAAPCDPLQLVPPLCDEPTLAWSCPEGAREHVAPWRSDRCLPLEGTADIVHEAPIAVPQGDRCAWWLPALEHEGEARAHLLVDVADGCDALALPASLEPAIETPEGADIVGVQAAIDGPRLLVRGWVLDPAGGFGVTALGVGFARREGARFVVPAWLFDPDTEDFGDAAITDGDHVYAYGCPGPPEWLEEDCFVARAPRDAIDDRTAWRTLGERGWGEGAARRVFGSGPHRGPVVRDPRGRGFLHVYAIGFGDRLEIQRADHPEGPWSAPRPLIDCELPEGDPDAYCAGPGIHVELFDPLRPDELVVSYSIGTLSPDGPERRARDPRGYWARVVRASLP
ncbi:DUF4185 domain-containing protein [Sandaracinus amylolyticus]|uniref:DUF4185 domain-containing protein n=1 Tax=Sandaracinus amylolyticus TaxID=927083 RepID=UPI001F189936|nr:DUF4185 domain-containing protein [Sandaracinus amylolyticus]UJR80086.1 Hypothetical protein I5071_21300 [Sandaracinus amylolyticus]